MAIINDTAYLKYCDFQLKIDMVALIGAGILEEDKN
jgi:hypothetical protein